MMDLARCLKSHGRTEGVTAYGHHGHAVAGGAGHAKYMRRLRARLHGAFAGSFY